MIHTTHKYIQIVHEHGHPKGNFYTTDPKTGTITILYNTGLRPVLLTVPPPPDLIRECAELLTRFLDIPDGSPIPNDIQVQIAHTLIKLQGYEKVQQGDEQNNTTTSQNSARVNPH